MNRAVYLGGLVAWLFLAGAAATGCSRAAEYCDAKCECELCNDRKYDACVIDKAADIDEADAYDCGDDYDKYLQCRLDESDCDNHHWTTNDPDDCDSERDDWHDCRDDASSLDDGNPSTVCSCECTCEQGMTYAGCAGNGCCGGACQSTCQNENLGGSTSNTEDCQPTGG